MQQAGIKRVQVLGPGEGNYCCAACSLLVDREFSVENAPELPPADCKCEGGSKIMYIALGEPKKEVPQGDTGKKLEATGDAMQKSGCMLTLFLTVPILIIFLLVFLFGF